jgi:uncharacterized membrane protein YccC
VAAAVVTAVVGFGLTFVGVLGGYTVAVRTPLLLSLVLAASVEAPFAQAADRVGGWLFGSGLSILAALFVWPRRDHDATMRSAALACDRLATIVRSRGTAGDTEAAAAAARAARESTGVRTAGTTSRQRAMAVLVEELDLVAEHLPVWLAAQEHSPVPGSDAELAAATADTLVSSARLLRGESTTPELARLDRARSRQRATVEHWAGHELHAGRAPDAVVAGLDAVRPLRLLSHGAVTIGGAATVATGGEVPAEWTDIPPRAPVASGARAAVTRAWLTLGAHLELRSVRFRDSVRAAAAFGIAVLIARLARLDHAFWAVLGSISVLRTSVIGAGRTAVEAMLGTVIGFLVVVPLMVLVGSDTAGLWLLLPVAVAVAGYSSVRWPLAAGQAAFTVLVVVLFNLIEPTGWKVGAVRLFDVATGCLVAVLVSLLFWPRGARAQVHDAIAELFRTAGAYLAACFGRVLSPTVLPSPGPELEVALGALRRAREALGDLLEERGPASADAAVATRLFATALNVRIAAERVDELAPRGSRLDACPDAAGVVRREADAVAAALAAGRPVVGAGDLADERRVAVVGCVAQWDGDIDRGRSVFTIVWVSQWVLELARLSTRLTPLVDGLPSGIGVVPADGPSRRPGGDALVGQVAAHDGTGGDDDMAADPGAGQHDGAVPEP